MDEKNLPQEILDRKKALIKPDDGKKITVKGTEIFYREEGSGPVLLYIHGNLACHCWFDEVMDVEGYRTIAPDLPNFGYSGTIESSEINTYGDFMIAFLRALEIDKVLVAGHSLGGLVAQYMAATEPELVEKMVLIDSGSVKGLQTPEESYPIIEQYKVNYGLLSQALAYIMPGLAEGPSKERLVDMALLMRHHCFMGHTLAVARFNMEKEAKECDLPVLVMRGAGDVLITQEMAEETAEAWKGRIHIFARSGHSPNVENPEDFKTVLKDFIA